MSAVSYRLCDPTGNVTILVTSPVPVQQQPETALRLMEIEKSAEQVGFLSNVPGADIALRMAGGEFCGNATMSAAAVCASDAGPRPGGERTMTVAVSGAEVPVPVSLRRTGKNEYAGRVEMPLPRSVEKAHLRAAGEELDAVIVRFPGISHVVLRSALSDDAAESAARQWCALLKADALGIMQLGDAGAMRPLVYVPGADTLFWESSCASGTSAVGAAEAFLREESVYLSLRQPGGELSVSASLSGGALTGLALGGRVSVGGVKCAEL